MEILTCLKLLIIFRLGLLLLANKKHVCFSLMVLRLFVWGFSSHSRIFSLIWRRHHYRWRAAYFNLYPALMAIELWVRSHLLCHGTSVYNGHLWGPVTLAPVTVRLEVELPLPVLTTLIVAVSIRTPSLPHARLTCLLTAPPPRGILRLI